MVLIKLLIVEDDRKRLERFEQWIPQGFRAVYAKTAGTAIGLLKRDRGHVYGGICLDHDLQQRAVIQSDRELSGSTVVDSVIQHVSTEVRVLIHSCNVKGALYMESKLEKAGFTTTRVAMDILSPEFFLQWLEEVREAWEENHEE